ncbi:MAG: DNA glycosylase [Clostridia bacterium]
MKCYELQNNKIIIKDKNKFNCEHTLLCGQIFRFKTTDSGYLCFSKNKRAIINNKDNGYEIITKDIPYFINFFDLDRDYDIINESLECHEVLRDAINFGRGIRIIKNDTFEMIISFIISASNNIPRIKKIIELLCLGAGKNMGEYYAFPTLEELKLKPLEFFESLHAGYRAKYLFQTVQYLTEDLLQNMKSMSTENAKKELLKLMGVGDKVADCILLFGLSKMNVFPVDTWIEKVYKTQFHGTLKSRKEMRIYFVSLFSELSGYAQQYLFYYKRTGKV